MTFVTPTGPPLVLGVAEAPAQKHQRDTQDLQVYFTREWTIGTPPLEVAARVIAADCAVLEFRLISFTTSDPAALVEVFDLPMCWTGDNAGKIWDDPFLGRTYQPIGSVAFVVPAPPFRWGGLVQSPSARPHGIDALFFSPTDQIDWSLTFFVTGHRAREAA